MKMHMIFQDRSDAAEKLAEKLQWIEEEDEEAQGESTQRIQIF